MFGETLLESAPALRRRNRWPMAAAFTMELAVAAVLVLLPLVSTGVLPLKASVIFPTPPKLTRVETREPVQRSGGRTSLPVPVTRVITVSTGGHRISDPFPERGQGDPDAPPNAIGTVIGDPNAVDLGLRGPSRPVPLPPPAKPLVVSRTTEAMLMNKVVPEYPQIAKLAGIQGDVRLHAFVDKNGTIQSLTVIGNPPPVLAKAALDAVQQWKYRPYLLNDVPVEIETFITVTFRKAN
ncbi:MAG TPA: energy transducer TonB [Candidatus Angelobacter sp.]